MRGEKRGKEGATQGGGMGEVGGGLRSNLLILNKGAITS